MLPIHFQCVHFSFSVIFLCEFNRICRETSYFGAGKNFLKKQVIDCQLSILKDALKRALLEFFDFILDANVKIII
jgi:hypothetical protein